MRPAYAAHALTASTSNRRTAIHGRRLPWPLLPECGRTGIRSQVAATPRIRSMSATTAVAIRPLTFCRTCQSDFGGIAAFDRHRVGKHAYLYSQEQPDGRRCLSEQEMQAKGMYLNRQG